MKKKQQHVDDNHNHTIKDLEIIKAVAQAWHCHSGGQSRPTNEFDAYRRNFKPMPSRFKLEAVRSGNGSRRSFNPCLNNVNHVDHIIASPYWDFGDSLWDAYEIVTVTKKLEAGLVFDDPFTGRLQQDTTAQRKRRKESKNSLRNLFKRVSSRRFKEADIPREDT